MKLYESEMKIMELIWQNEPVSAKELSVIAHNEIGWNKNTTYTAIKKCVEKGLISEKETVLTISFTGTDVSIAFEAPDDLFT